MGVKERLRDREEGRDIVIVRDKGERGEMKLRDKEVDSWGRNGVS